MNEKWDTRFLQLANHIAQWSKDPSTKVGSVIVDQNKKVVAMGYNGFPRAIEDLEERYAERDTKIKYVVHAERNALDNASVDTSGFTLYCTLLPCSECAKSIIQKGIHRVVTVSPVRSGEGFNWDLTRSMFYESGVVLVEYLPEVLVI